MELKEYMQWKGYSGKEVAERAGVDASYISRILTGERVPGRLAAKTISEATDGHVSVIELLYPKRKAS